MRLQGFPDDYKFSGERADVIRQIGNSVSPYIAFK
ncbi:MAG: DNA cytosine methyltransferase [Sphingomonas sp.]|nr:DNA cytosine methyltransferase [Sphingomonas sp.]